jgi:acylphosphatase
MSEHISHPISEICYHIIFSGRVQGVGFRFTAQRFAADRGLTGWVRNLPDGSVEARVEGEAGAASAFLAQLQTHFDISDIRKSEHPFSGMFTGFVIEY